MMWCTYGMQLSCSDVAVISHVVGTDVLVCVGMVAAAVVTCHMSATRSDDSDAHAMSKSCSNEARKSAMAFCIPWEMVPIVIQLNLAPCKRVCINLFN